MSWLLLLLLLLSLLTIDYSVWQPETHVVYCHLSVFGKETSIYLSLSLSLIILAHLIGQRSKTCNRNIDEANVDYLATLWTSRTCSFARQKYRRTRVAVCVFDPLEFKGNYSATLNNMKLVHWPLMGGLLCTFGTARRGLGGATARPGWQAPPR